MKNQQGAPEALRLADAIDPFVRKESPDHLTSKVAADELRRQHALLNEQQRTIEALNACINGEGSTTTENLRLVDRLHAENEALRAQPAGAATPAAPAPGVPDDRIKLATRIKQCAEHWAYMERIDHGDQAKVEQSRHAEMVDMLAAAPQSPATAGAVDALRTAAQAVVDRWDTPLWKDAPATAEYIGMLRAALAAQRATHQGDHK